MRLVHHLVLLLALSIGSVASGQESDQAKKPGKSVATLTRYSMKLASNGLSVNAYPKDPTRPFDSGDWYVEIPLTVIAVKFDTTTQELLVAVDYTFRKTDEDAFKAQLAWRYKEAGKPIAPEAISITPLEVVAHSLVLRDMDKEYVLFETDKKTKLTAQTVAFRVPMQDYADRLHGRLAKTPEAVQIVLRAGYRFDRVAALTVERRALNSAWHDLCEKALPIEAKKAETLLVDREIEQKLLQKLAMFVETTIRSYGLSKEEEAELLKTLLSQLKETSTPYSVRELLEEGDKAMILTVKNEQINVKAAVTSENLTKLKESMTSSETVKKVAKSISEISRNNKLTTRDFHSQARKFVLDGGLGFGPFSANMHLEKSENEVTEKQYEEVKAARDFARNESNFASSVEKSYNRELEGRAMKFTSIAPLLRLRRISAASLAAVSMEGTSIVRITGSDAVFSDTPISLKATPHPEENDVVAKMLMQMSAAQEGLLLLNKDLEQLKAAQKRVSCVSMDQRIEWIKESPSGGPDTKTIYSHGPGQDVRTLAINSLPKSAKVIAAWTVQRDHLSILAKSFNLIDVWVETENNSVVLDVRSNSDQPSGAGNIRIYVMYEH